jgi:hypothetical protein
MVHISLCARAGHQARYLNWNVFYEATMRLNQKSGVIDTNETRGHHRNAVRRCSSLIGDTPLNLFGSNSRDGTAGTHWIFDVRSTPVQKFQYIYLRLESDQVNHTIKIWIWLNVSNCNLAIPCHLWLIYETHKNNFVIQERTIQSLTPAHSASCESTGTTISCQYCVTCSFNVISLDGISVVRGLFYLSISGT